MKKIYKTKSCVRLFALSRLITLALLLNFLEGNAQISFTGSSYSQNFNPLSATSGTGVAWTNNSTLPGWFLFRQPAPGTALATYNVDAGGSNAGAFVSMAPHPMLIAHWAGLDRAVLILDRRLPVI